MASTIRGSHNDHHLITYGVRSHSTGGQIFDALNALGTVAFAFAAHSVALEIQATIPSSPQKPSKKPMWRGCLWAYIIVAFCYLSVSISGFWAFGNAVDDDILVSLEKPRLLIAIANLMVFFHVLGSYQVRNIYIIIVLFPWIFKDSQLYGHDHVLLLCLISRFLLCPYSTC